MKKRIQKKIAELERRIPYPELDVINLLEKAKNIIAQPSQDVETMIKLFVELNEIDIHQYLIKQNLKKKKNAIRK